MLSLVIGNSEYKFFELGENLMKSWLFGAYNFFEWLISYSINFGGETYYLYEFMFGTGVTLFAAYVLAKWIIDFS